MIAVTDRRVRTRRHRPPDSRRVRNRRVASRTSTFRERLTTIGNTTSSQHDRSTNTLRAQAKARRGPSPCTVRTKCPGLARGPAQARCDAQAFPEPTSMSTTFWVSLLRIRSPHEKQTYVNHPHAYIPEPRAHSQSRASEYLTTPHLHSYPALAGSA